MRTAAGGDAKWPQTPEIQEWLGAATPRPGVIPPTGERLYPEVKDFQKLRNVVKADVRKSDPEGALGAGDRPRLLPAPAVSAPVFPWLP